jgi:hypothetical protein
LADGPTSKPQIPGAPRISGNDWIVGKLTAHGPAPYRFEQGNSDSYYVKIRELESEQGARREQDARDRADRPIDGRAQDRPQSSVGSGERTLWGTDLRRAIERSKSGVKVGDVVAARLTGREPVYSKSGALVPNAYLNRWEVETPQFVARRGQAARAVNESHREGRRLGAGDPESLALYLIHDGAERLARLRYADPGDQERFIAGVRRFFESSPDREAVIAKAVERIRAAGRLPPAALVPENQENKVETSREPPVRE